MKVKNPLSQTPLISTWVFYVSYSYRVHALKLRLPSLFICIFHQQLWQSRQLILLGLAATFNYLVHFFSWAWKFLFLLFKAVVWLYIFILSLFSCVVFSEHYSLKYSFSRPIYTNHMSFLNPRHIALISILLDAKQL